MFIIGYPKSGNTWLCYLISFCLNSAFDNYDDPGPHNIVGDFMIKNVMGTLPHRSFEMHTGKVLKTHRLKIKNPKKEPVVYLVRDGRDVMISYYFYKNCYLKKEQHNTPNINITGEPNLGNTELSNFIRTYIPEWYNHLKQGMKQFPDHIIRYEDLKGNPFKTLYRLFTSLGLDLDPMVIEESIRTFDFENITQRKVGIEQRDSFFRKGICGDWKNYFSQEDLEYYFNIVGNISDRLGWENHETSL